MQEYDHRHFSFERKLNGPLHIDRSYSDYVVAAWEIGLRCAIFMLGSLILWMAM